MKITLYNLIIFELSDFTAQKMKFSIKDFFSKCDQIRRKLRIWSHLLKKSLMENFIFCEVFHIARKKLNTKIFIWAESVIINNNNTSFQKGNWGQNITPTFLHIFVNIMEKKPSTKFYDVSDYFWGSCKVTKFWMIRRCLYVLTSSTRMMMLMTSIQLKVCF